VLGLKCPQTIEHIPSSHNWRIHLCSKPEQIQVSGNQLSPTPVPIARKAPAPRANKTRAVRSRGMYSAAGIKLCATACSTNDPRQKIDQMLRSSQIPPFLPGLVDPLKVEVFPWVNHGKAKKQVTGT